MKGREFALQFQQQHQTLRELEVGSEQYSPQSTAQHSTRDSCIKINLIDLLAHGSKQNLIDKTAHKACSS